VCADNGKVKIGVVFSVVVAVVSAFVVTVDFVVVDVVVEDVIVVSVVVEVEVVVYVVITFFNSKIKVMNKKVIFSLKLFFRFCSRYVTVNNSL
jgi:hypothetical protein